MIKKSWVTVNVYNNVLDLYISLFTALSLVVRYCSCFIIIKVCTVIIKEVESRGSMNIV